MRCRNFGSSLSGTGVPLPLPPIYWNQYFSEKFTPNLCGERT